MISNGRKTLLETYWTDYFRRLDELAPHDPASRANDHARARTIIVHSCKDGVLFWFEQGDELTFRYRSSGVTIQTLFNKLTDPIGLNFDEFPAEHDIGPIKTAEGKPGETVPLSVLFSRSVWFQTRTRSLNSSDAIRRAENDHEERQQPNFWEAPTPPPRSRREQH